MIRFFKQPEARRRFDDLVLPHMASILRLANILCGGQSAEGEDLAQETLIKAFKSIDRFKEGTNVKSWLTTILRNTRIDRLRASRAQRAVSLNELDEPLLVAPDLLAETDCRDPVAILEDFSDQQVVDALQQLPEEIRWTLLLVDVEGLDHQAAASILSVPVGTIKSRAHRGRAMLRDVLLPVARELGLAD